jgi:hypothetical protein
MVVHIFSLHGAQGGQIYFKQGSICPRKVQITKIKHLKRWKNEEKIIA